ncbi:MAG: hypothetical protein Kow0068_03400 [Marinilabiliales bacterium]
MKILPLSLKKQHIIIIVLVGLSVYINTVINDYNLDDEIVTNGHPIVKMGFSGIEKIFTNHYVDDEGLKFGFRPLVQLSFILEYELFGFNPHISHLINVILYIIVCVLIYNLLAQVFKDVKPLMILFITLLFVVHPIHTEVVASIKNRDEIFSMIFSLISINYLIRYDLHKKIISLIFFVIFLFLALISKISALIYMPVGLLTLYYVNGLKFKNLLLYVFIIIMVFIGYKLFVNGMVGAETNRPINFYENPLVNEKLYVKIFTGFVILLHYLRLFIIPHPLICYYGYDMVSVRESPDYLTLISFVIHVSILIIGLIGLKRKSMFSFAILTYMFSISIYMNVPKVIPGILAERFAFFAVLGFVIIIGKLLFEIIDKYVNNFKYKYILLSLLLMPYSTQSIARNFKWKDPVTLFENDIKYAGNSVKLNDLLASEYMKKLPETKNKQERKKILDKAQKYYKQCIRLNPENAMYWNDMGLINFIYYQDFDKAIYYFQNSLKCEPDNIDILFNVSQAYLYNGDTVNAIKYLNKILEIDNTNNRAISSLANLYLILKDIKKAEYYCNLLLQNFPLQETTNVLNGNLSIMKKDTLSAIAYYEKADRINPNNNQTNRILHFLYDSQKMNDKISSNN